MGLGQCPVGSPTVTPPSLFHSQWGQSGLCCQFCPLPPSDPGPESPVSHPVSAPVHTICLPELLGLIPLLGNQELRGKPYSDLLCPSLSVSSLSPERENLTGARAHCRPGSSPLLEVLGRVAGSLLVFSLSPNPRSSGVDSCPLPGGRVQQTETSLSQGSTAAVIQKHCICYKAKKST